jgi:hypothetical protein
LLLTIWAHKDSLDRVATGAPKISDIEWDEHTAIKFPGYAIIAGLVTGLVGIRGAIVKGPLMLH